MNQNMGLENLLSAQMKNQLAPQFAQLMQQYGGQAGDFFKNLMNLGSPYYKQHQQEAFTQGVGQNQNAAAQAQQQLRAQGYGNTPSGANAAMIGGMNQAGSQNLAEQYLQNLFQNESMQMQGAGGLSTMASLFNPSQLLGGTSIGTVQPVLRPNAFQNALTAAQAGNQVAQAGATMGAGCWIAAAVYDGWDDPRTIDVRYWLNTEFTKTTIGKLVMKVYLKIGRQVAWFVERSKTLRRVFKPLFDKALRKARGEDNVWAFQD